MRRAAGCLLLDAFASPLLADDWPRWLGPKRDGVWREHGIIEKFPEGARNDKEIVCVELGKS